MMDIKLKITYFAQLRELAAKGEEILFLSEDDEKRHSDKLYLFLKEKYLFPFTTEQLRIAINGDFSSWDYRLADGDEIVFIPPVTGG